MTDAKGTSPAHPQAKIPLIYLLTSTVLLLICWKLWLWYLIPVPVLDGVWSLSQTFSVLRGNFLESSFAHEPIKPFLMPYGFAVLTAPFYAVMQGPMSIFIADCLTVLVSFFLLDYFYTKLNAPLVLRWFAVFATAGALASYSLRSEVLSIPLMILLFMLLTLPEWRNSKFGVILAGVLTTIIGLIHPVHGILAGLLGIVELGWKRDWRDLSKYCISVAVTLLVMYGPVVAVNPNYWFTTLSSYSTTNIGSKKDSIVYLFGYFTAYNPLLICLPVWLLLFNRKLWAKELLAFAIVALVVYYFNRHYYLVVFGAYLMARAPFYFKDKLRLKYLILPLFFIQPMWSHYNWTIKTLENPDYSRTAWRIHTEIAGTRGMDVASKRYVSGFFAMNVIDLPNSELYSPFYKRLFHKKYHLAPGDTLLCVSQEELDQIKQDVGNPESDLIVTEIVPECKGLVSPRFLLGEKSRNNAIGLWGVGVKRANVEMDSASTRDSLFFHQ